MGRTLLVVFLALSAIFPAMTLAQPRDGDTEEDSSVAGAAPSAASSSHETWLHEDLADADARSTRARNALIATSVTATPPELSDIGEDLLRRLGQVERCLLEVLDQDTLLDHSLTLQRSLQLRRAYLDLINLVQAELLRRQRLEDDDELQDALLATVNDVAAGLKNTGERSPWD